MRKLFALHLDTDVLDNACVAVTGQEEESAAPCVNYNLVAIVFI